MPVIAVDVGSVENTQNMTGQAGQKNDLSGTGDGRLDGKKTRRDRKTFLK